jgi:hypothetical protein
MVTSSSSGPTLRSGRASARLAPPSGQQILSITTATDVSAANAASPNARPATRSHGPLTNGNLASHAPLPTRPVAASIPRQHDQQQHDHHQQQQQQHQKTPQLQLQHQKQPQKPPVLQRVAANLRSTITPNSNPALGAPKPVPKVVVAPPTGRTNIQKVQQAQRVNGVTSHPTASLAHDDAASEASSANVDQVQPLPNGVLAKHIPAKRPAPEESRSLRSKAGGTRLKSDLAIYFANFDDIITDAPKSPGSCASKSRD